MIAQVCKQVSNNTRVNRMGTPVEGVIARGTRIVCTLGPNALHLYMLGAFW